MNRIKSIAEYISFCCSLLCLAALVGGTKACQEDYVLGSQINVTPSATPTETSDDGDTVTKTHTSTATPSRTPTATATATRTATPTATVAASVTTSASTAFLRELSAASEPKAKLTDGYGQAATKANSVNSVKVENKVSGAVGNWLGQGFNKENSEVNLDSDTDGYTDRLELELGTDINSADQYPEIVNKTSLFDRLRITDSDMDGLSDTDESAMGSSLTLKDSDTDGCNDGAEVLSGTDQLNAKSRPQDDFDFDCLSRSFEQSAGLSASLSDTDGDGLRDDEELAIGSNPLNSDTDGDGILDGKEVNQKTDPIKPDIF